MKKKLISILALLLVACMVMAGCAQTQPTPQGGTPTGAPQGGGATPTNGGDKPQENLVDGPKNILFIATGFRGDGGMEDGIYDVCKIAADKLGGELVCIECNYDASLFEPSIMDGCESGEYALIVTGFYNTQEAVMKGAEQYPNQKFLCYDEDFDYASGKYNNIVSYQIRQNECGFLSGAIAALLTNSGKEGTNPEKVVGFTGEIENTAVQDFLVGYIEGVNYVDSQIEVLYSFIGSNADTAKAKELSLAQIQRGADVVYAVAGQCCLGVVEAAYESNAWALNCDIDWSSIIAETNPGMARVNLTSSSKEFPAMIGEALDQFVAGELEFGVHHMLGWGDGAIEMYENSTFYELFDGELLEAYKKICDDVAAGNIAISTAIGATPEQVNAIKDLAKPY